VDVARLLKRHIPTGVAVVVLTLGLTPAAGALPSRTQTPPVPPVAVESLTGSARQCVEEAIGRDAATWVCNGDLLTTPEGSEMLPPVPDPEPESLPPSDPQARSSTEGEWYDDYEADDTWCEPSNSSPCINQVSKYLSQAKSNMIYGDEDGVIGSFDWIVRLNLNGRSARFSVTLNYDEGPKLTFIRNDIACRENVPGVFDSSCGFLYMGSPFTIEATNEEFKYGPRNSSNIVDAGTYFGEGRMQFQPDGKDYVWTVPAPLSLMGPGPQSERFICPTENRECYFNR
jgi:hypothetical protein